MRILLLLTAICLIVLVLWETFETIVLPRKIERKFRVTRYYYLFTWLIYRTMSERIGHPRRRAVFLSIFGPLSLLGLFVVWGVSLIFAFALLSWSVHTPFKLPDGGPPGFAWDLYVSGTTLTTLGLGDVTPRSPAGRFALVVESGLGLGLVALVIGYLPTLYQAFSRRETEISLLDARAGSPPSATELLYRSAQGGSLERLDKLLADWERWCAEILESHISYPVLCYFRSQHANQSWITALTAILDACALCLACLEHKAASQAHLTFAMAHHAVVDITQVFHQKPSANPPERLRREAFQTICESLRQEGLPVRPEEESWNRLRGIRQMYEPYVFTLSRHLRMDLAPWTHPSGMKDNWVATKWKGPNLGSSE